METLYARCAGLDVHKDSVVACARLVTEAGVQQHVRSFGTTTNELLTLADWLIALEVTAVAMEATGVYWKPVWHVLDGSFDLVLANAQHVKNVPGRKTDVNDATWLADLLAHGLIRASFVPPTEIQDMRTLMRTRKQLVRERSQHVLRLQKVLEDANIKLSSVVSNIVGCSGRAILQALADGETDPQRLVACTTGKLKATRESLIAALRGRVRPHHRFLLKLHLAQIDALDQAISAVEAEVGPILEPFRHKAELLTAIPGISDTAAQVVVSEIGVDMSRFPTAGHLRSWATFCPRNDESAGKRRSTMMRKGAQWLKEVLVQAAWAAVRNKDTYFRAQFFRLKARRGPKKAIVAVASSMLTAIYYVLRDEVAFRDLGVRYFDALDKDKAVKRLSRRLADLGYEVTLKEAA